MFKKILIALGIVTILFLIVVAVQPSTYSVTRTTTISGPAPAVFAQVNDFHNWEAWSPWAKLDPAMKQSYEGAAAGKGAVYTWAGNHNVGEGRMTIAESRPAEFIRVDLAFLKPMKGTSQAEFTFRQEGNQTAVTWSMTGQKNFISKAIGLFISMDKMIGGNFESGLAQMKKVVEGSVGK